jgi:Flp pilus assembly pilin Flp
MLHAFNKFPRLARLPVARRRRAVARLTGTVIRDDRGGEVLEYALIAGLIVIAAVGAITCFGLKLRSRWNRVNTSLS